MFSTSLKFCLRWNLALETQRILPALASHRTGMITYVEGYASPFVSTRLAVRPITLIFDSFYFHTSLCTVLSFVLFCIFSAALALIKHCLLLLLRTEYTHALVCVHARVRKITAVVLRVNDKREQKKYAYTVEWCSYFKRCSEITITF